MKVGKNTTTLNLNKKDKVLSPPSREARDRITENVALIAMDGFFISDICREAATKGKKQPLDFKKFDKFSLFLLATSFVIVAVDIYKAVKEHFDEKKYNEQIKNLSNN